MLLKVNELTRESFTPYGTVIEQPSGEPDGAGDGWSWWGETLEIPQTDRPYSVGYLALSPASLRFDWAEYHRESKEIIIPMGQDCLVYVGRPGAEPEWDRFEVYRVRPGQGVMLDEGVWHGAPLAMDRALTALVLLRQGAGSEDVYKATRADGFIDIAED